MAHYCNAQCEEIGGVCDFCRLFDFHAAPDGAYTGDGWCRHYHERSDPGAGGPCHAFICQEVSVQIVAPFSNLPVEDPMNQLPKPGNTVTMKKGAEVHSMHPKRHNYTLRRKQAVKVHASYPAFECDQP